MDVAMTSLFGGDGLILGEGLRLASTYGAFSEGAPTTAAAVGGTGLLIGAAGGIGYGTGKLISDHMKHNTLDGLYGNDDVGRARDATDFGADAGIAVEDTFQSALGVEEDGKGFWNTAGDLAGGALGGLTAGAVGAGAAIAGLDVEMLRAAASAEEWLTR
jgi:hypothetical protein